MKRAERILADLRDFELSIRPRDNSTHRQARDERRHVIVVRQNLPRLLRAGIDPQIDVDDDRFAVSTDRHVDIAGLR